jgi:dolichol-phosphate mannosyltransferase
METSLLAVIVPMYDEEQNAQRCVRAICAVLQRSVPGARLFVVNDGSRDGTESILERLDDGTLPFTRLGYPDNRGYGAALAFGARAAREAGFEFGLFMDSDLTNDPELIPVFAERAASGGYDLLKASRYVAGGGMKGVPFRRQIVTRTGNWLARRLFGMGIRDCTNGFRAVRLSLLAGIVFRERGFPQIMEELVALKRQGARATEIPYVLTSRTADEGSSKFSYRPRVVLAYLKYALLAAVTPYRPRTSAPS